MEEIKSEEDNESTCQHGEHEDCMNCVDCGKCSESLDDDDRCSDCRASHPTPPQNADILDMMGIDPKHGDR